MRRLAVASLLWLLAAFAPAVEAQPAPLTTPLTTVVAVRHAEKATDQGSDPHLTAQGEARAEALAAMLTGEVPVGGLYSSEFHRTRETLVPLSERFGMDVHTVPASETNQHLTAAWLIDNHPNQVVVVAGHSNTIPSLVEALTGVPTPELDESIYDALFLITVHSDGTAHALRLNYGARSEAPGGD